MATFYGQFDSIHARHKLKVDGITELVGATTITGALTQTGAVALASTLDVAGAVTFDTTLAVEGVTTLTESLNATKTDVTAPANTIYAIMDLGVSYSAGSANAVKGYVTSDAVAGQTVRNMSAGWFGLNWAAGFKATGAGASRALAAEVVNVSVGQAPNAVLYLQSIASGASSDNSDMPYIVMTDSGAGTQSNIMLELGHGAAGQTVPTGTSGFLEYHQTLRIIVNASDGYIPYSTVEGTYTTAYPIAITGATVTASQSGLTSNVSVSEPSNSDGIAALFQANASDTFAGSSSASGSWMNFGSATVTGAYIVSAQSNGIYGTATMTNTDIVFGLKMEGIVVGTPDTFCPFYLGTANRVITALFRIASGASIGNQNGTVDTSYTGSVPLFVDNEGTVKYVNVCDAAAS